jgi:hypothetical protein
MSVSTSVTKEYLRRGRVLAEIMVCRTGESFSTPAQVVRVSILR